jgi:hypothetical protein
MKEDLISNENSNKVNKSEYNKNKWTENINRLKLKNIFNIF